MSKPFKVDVIFDANKLASKIEKASQIGLRAVGVEALKDANFYARMDTGEMIRSSITAFSPPTHRSFSVRLEWITPYAGKVYYTGTPSKEENPNASLLWAHKGYAENFKKYEEMLQKSAERETK